MSDVSVIMVSYYTGPALWLAIDSVLEQTECRELVLVDNGNSPGVKVRLEALAKSQPRLKLITGQGNVGFAKGCNLGARASSANMLLFLNPDSMLPEGGLSSALHAIQKFPDDTLAGCYLVNPDGSEQRGCRRALLSPRNALSESLGIKRLLKGAQPLNFVGLPMPGHVHEVPAVSGAFIMLSRAFFDRLKGFDEGYFLHMEDMDLCARVHAAGGKVICMPEVKVIHFRSTSEAASAVVERHKTQGFIRYLKTHFKGSYSGFQLSCMSIGLWMRYALKAVAAKLDKAFVPPLAGKFEVARVVLLYRLARFGPRDNSLAGKTILVTGGSGQIGLCVVGMALSRGAQVIATYRNTRVSFTHPNLVWAKGDLANDKLEAKADVLIHTAGLGHLPKLLPDLAACGIHRVIAFGSTSVLSKSGSKNAYERSIVEGLKSAEEESAKVAAEKKCHLTLLRPTMIYGIGLDANITRLADVIRRFGILPVYGDANGRRQPVQATDLAKAALNIIDNATTFDKSYNLGGMQVMTYRTMVTMLFQYLGKKPRLFRLPFMPQLLNVIGKLYQVSYLNGEMAHRMNKDLVFDIQDAVQDFGYDPAGYLQGNVEL